MLDDGDMLEVRVIDCWGWDSFYLDHGVAAGAETAAEMRDQCFLFSVAFLEMEESQIGALVDRNSTLFMHGFLCFRGWML